MRLFGFTFAAILTATAWLADLHGAEICEESWAKVTRIRGELGLPPGPMPEGSQYDPRACQALLDTPDDELRASIQELDAICGDVCRKLHRKDLDGLKK